MIIEVSAFMTSDGALFETKDAAVNHENNIKITTRISSWVDVHLNAEDFHQDERCLSIDQVKRTMCENYTSLITALTMGYTRV